MNENFWSYRLQKLGTLKVLGMDGQTERRTLLQNGFLLVANKA